MPLSCPMGKKWIKKRKNDKCIREQSFVFVLAKVICSRSQACALPVTNAGRKAWWGWVQKPLNSMASFFIFLRRKKMVWIMAEVLVYGSFSPHLWWEPVPYLNILPNKIENYVQFPVQHMDKLYLWQCHPWHSLPSVGERVAFQCWLCAVHMWLT